MPGRTKVTKIIDELNEDMMMKLKDMFKQSNSVSLTTDAAKLPTGDSCSHHRPLDQFRLGTTVSCLSCEHQ